MARGNFRLLPHGGEDPGARVIGFEDGGERYECGRGQTTPFTTLAGKVWAKSVSSNLQFLTAAGSMLSHVSLPDLCASAPKERALSRNYAVTLAEVAATMGVALTKLAQKVDRNEIADLKQAKEIALESLCRVLRMDEAIQCVRIITTKRIRCLTCKSCVPVMKASSGVCHWCVSKVKNEARSNHDRVG